MSEKQLLVFNNDHNTPMLNNIGALLFYTPDSGKKPMYSHGELLPAKEYSDDEIGIFGKRYGAIKAITFTKENELEKEAIPIIKNHQYFNSELDRLIIKYKTQKDDTLVKKIGEMTFLIPIRIAGSDSKNKKYPILKYLSASLKNSKKKYHVVFSNYEEYKSWNKMTHDNWQLIKVTKYELRHINKNYNILINPCGNRLIVEGDKMKYFYFNMKK